MPSWHSLQEVHLLLGMVVVLAVPHTLASARELDLAAPERLDIAQTVFVCKLSAKNVAEDFGIGVRVCWEACFGRNAVLVDDAKRAKAHVRRVVVAGKGEGMAGPQPAVIGVAALPPAARGCDS